MPAPPRPSIERSPAAGVRSAAAFAALLCAIASWVPLIIVITGPPTVLFSLIAFLAGRRAGDARAMRWAGWSIFLLLAAIALQAGFVGVAFVIGWIG